MSGSDHLLSAPWPIRLARVCLWGQALMLLVPLLALIQHVRQGSGDLTAPVVVMMIVPAAVILALLALAVMITSRRNWVRLSAVWLQSLVALRSDHHVRRRRVLLGRPGAPGGERRRDPTAQRARRRLVPRTRTAGYVSRLSAEDPAVT